MSFVRTQRSRLLQPAALGALLTLALLCAGCFGSKAKPIEDPTLNGPVIQEPTIKEPATTGTVIPLTPAFWISPSLMTAVISYQDACKKPAAMLIDRPLIETIQKKLNKAFTGVTTQIGTDQTIVRDGVMQVGLGLKRIDLETQGQVAGTYRATATVGIEAAFLAAEGKTLFGKKLQGVGRGGVTVIGQSCEVTGLEPIVQQAIDSVTDELVKQIDGSVRVREYASQPRAEVSFAAAAMAPRIVRQPAPVVSVPSAEPAAKVLPQATVLAFHAIIRDESRDQILQPDESLMVEVEVKNEGTLEAKGVEVVVGGMPELTTHFPSPLSIGDLQPGEVKRMSITERVAASNEELRGELVLSVRSATALAPPLPPDKKFSLLIKPGQSGTGAAAHDVDRLPLSFAASKQQRTVVIAIGVGEFRNKEVPAVKYAAHDADMMAGYLRAIAGTPQDRVRVLSNVHALQQDLVETFDEWLPKRVDEDTVVYIFFAGRAVVDGATGAVSLVPFDGTPTAMNRLYSVRRLQESLARLPIERAIMMFDVSLDPSPGADPAATPSPDWTAGAGDSKEQFLWMVGNRALQEAHSYEQGKHGLFTYYLLRGLQGFADADRDGTVVAGELCSYARGQVAQVAVEQFGNKQDPLCIPPPGRGAVVRIHPVAKGNNPKPATVTKKAEPAIEKAPQTQTQSPTGLMPDLQ
jgi:hypothetical protein